jgi:hypothetical protein
MKSIWEHPESKRRAVMTRIEPDAKLPRHRHVGDELIFLIEGANGFIHAHGPRVAESGLGVITGWAFSAPYEDLKLKGK